MAFYYLPKGVEAAGQFINEWGTHFEYSNRKQGWYAGTHPHVIHMTNGETRFAKINKTVLEIIVDEDEYGNPVFEKWAIKNHRQYA